MAPPISATQLHDHLVCPHRVSMDAHADPARREPPNSFIEMLWARGSAFEAQIVAGLAEPFTDLSRFSGDEKERATREALARGDALIYNGRLSVPGAATFGEPGLVGEPDLLCREGRDEATGRALYVPLDIKSGSAYEAGSGIRSNGDEDGEGEGAPKAIYAVQLALYVDLLERLGASAGRYGYVLDVDRRRVTYRLEEFWPTYAVTVDAVQRALVRPGETRPASAACCKLCVWRRACLQDLQAARDLTLLPELGRAKRDTLAAEFATIDDLAAADVEACIVGSRRQTTRFKGIGPDTLRTMQRRARLATQLDPQPYLKRRIDLPRAEVEIFFDIETDPMRELCYLHGFVVREGGDVGSERFHGLFAEGVTRADERESFAAAMRLFRRHPRAVVYIYSKYERTIYRQLAARYPQVATTAEVEELFAPERTVDLYNDIVRRHCEFPTTDFSIKSVAGCLGFKWRDTHPSGAASIQWFQRWADTGEPALRQRLLDYNEDDCRAMRVLVDALPGMEVREPPST